MKPLGSTKCVISFNQTVAFLTLLCSNTPSPPTLTYECSQSLKTCFNASASVFCLAGD